MWLRPVITSVACSAARSARRASAVTMRSRTSVEAARTCSCSTFSVRSREVMPAWIRSWPARAENSSIRAFTSWRVTRSRASMLARSTLSITATWSSMTSRGTSTPELVLRSHDRHPELPLEHHLVLRRPDVDHRPAGVAGGQHVGQVSAGHALQSPTRSRPARQLRWPRDRRGPFGPIGLRGSSRLVTRPLSSGLPRRGGRRRAIERCWTAAASTRTRWASPSADGAAAPGAARCLVYAFGPKKPPYCMSCAMVAGGVRTSGVAPGDVPQRSSRPR